MGRLLKKISKNLPKTMVYFVQFPSVIHFQR